MSVRSDYPTEAEAVSSVKRTTPARDVKPEITLRNVLEQALKVLYGTEANLGDLRRFLECEGLYPSEPEKLRPEEPRSSDRSAIELVNAINEIAHRLNYKASNIEAVIRAQIGGTDEL